MDIDLIVRRVATYRGVEAEPSATLYAVVIVLARDRSNNQEGILVLQRNSNLSSYAGDWCLPGGCMDLSDDTLLATALRELQEEIGITKNDGEIVGVLDDFRNGNGNVVRPFVFRLADTICINDLHINSKESTRCTFLRLDSLLDIKIDTDNRFDSRRKPSYILQLALSTTEEQYIWGLTACILAHFSNISYGFSYPIDKDLQWIRTGGDAHG